MSKALQVLPLEAKLPSGTPRKVIIKIKKPVRENFVLPKSHFVAVHTVTLNKKEANKFLFNEIGDIMDEYRFLKRILKEKNIIDDDEHLARVNNKLQAIISSRLIRQLKNKDWKIYTAMDYYNYLVDNKVCERFKYKLEIID
jgi:hypothetical protein